jgi:hypothetical protein
MRKVEGGIVDFLGIGAQKSGTTWLADNLGRHPEVFLAPEKELHYWNAHRDKGLDWYVGHFASAPSGCMRGEITPAYAILSSAVVAQIAAALPGVRLLYLVRNPVERAWSAALMALERAEMAVDEASDQWFVDHFRSRGSRARTDYESCLRTWLSHFPAEQLLIGRYDDVRDSPVELLERCADHLSLSSGHFWKDPERARVVSRRGTGAPLRPSLRRVLEDMHGPSVESLESWLGWDLSAWRTDPSAAAETTG